VALSEQLVTEVSPPSCDLPLLLHDFFDRARRRWPDRIALEIPPGFNREERRRVSYEDLGRQTDAIANVLRRIIHNECVVAILLPRSTEFMFSAQLAVLKSGAAYTCIDESFPDRQVLDIINDSGAVALLTNSANRPRVERLGIKPLRVYYLDEIESDAHASETNLSNPDWLTPTSLAYVIYTSGSTGRPKGVMIQHDSIVNLVGGNLDEFGFSPNHRVAQNSSASYDSSVEEIWLALAAGATLVVVDDDTVRLGPDLIDWLRKERITVLCPPPTLLRTTGCHDPHLALPDLSFVYVGGEALPRDVAETWARGRQLVNGYGPTECTVTCVRGAILPGQPITIGRPIRGMQAWVLNESFEEVPPGAQGELCMGGVGVARGYHNREKLTSEKFCVHPVLGRIYRTGDLVHRDEDGVFFYHGRIDSQVKIRGYRVELEAIESRLSQCPGVREAACGVQGESPRQTLVAFIVGDDSLSFDDLRTYLREALPPYMVPARFARLDALPRTIGGKLNRAALPEIEIHESPDSERVSARNDIEAAIEAAFRQVLGIREPISIYADFFNDLGGDSLAAAELISLLRDRQSMCSINVRDLYESRTVAGLAERAREELADVTVERQVRDVSGHPVLASAIQGVWLLIALAAGSSAAYATAFLVLPSWTATLGLVPSMLLSPVVVMAALAIYAPLAVLFSAAVKIVLIGRYKPLRAPVWGSFYVRNWIVQQTVKIVPWFLLEGTVFQVLALRAFGARIGKRVHLHRGVSLLQGGWDLLTIGDDVTIAQDASLRLVDLDDGDIVVGPVTIGDGATIDVRADVGGNSFLEPGAFLTALSSVPDGSRIPAGERWDGIPAAFAGSAPMKAHSEMGGREISPILHSCLMLSARAALAVLLGVSLELPLIIVAAAYGFDTDDAVAWLSNPRLNAGVVAAAIVIAVASVPIGLLSEALAMRLMGRVREGVISRWSLEYLRVWIKTQTVQSASDWLSGTLMWPVWLRLAGMKVGTGCEISTIIDAVPELVEIGRESFFADGIYLAGPRVHRGAVVLEHTRVGQNTFLGNHAVVPAGQSLPDGILIGICTVADDRLQRRGSSWFGHPAFELPRREVVECDRSLTHEPSRIRFLNRVFWELLRFALPVAPAYAATLWYRAMSGYRLSASPVVLTASFMSAAVIAAFCLVVVALKWLLLGRVRPGTHPLWSCWCSRWDFLYVAWSVYARTSLSFLEGTLMLSIVLRAMGARIGKRVVLGGGFSQVVDPDMLRFEDGATVCCQFQAHTFEDRVLKIDRVRIQEKATVGHSAVLLYGADIGAGTRVAAGSVVMKRESLTAGRSYSGCPTRPLASSQLRERAGVASLP